MPNYVMIDRAPSKKLRFISTVESRNNRLIVTPWKFDVLKTIFARSEKRSFEDKYCMLVFGKSNLQGAAPPRPSLHLEK